MPTNPEHPAAQRIVDEIRSAFPAEAAKIDGRLARQGFEDAPYTWVERFSQLTTDAIKRGDAATAVAHLKVVSRLLAGGDELTQRCIDTAYVESLMWDVKDEKAKQAGWKLMPGNLRRLYVAMWGEQPFMKGGK